ncbi:MAG: ANTAR domain-containing protein [Treponema sp.]|nr:ANTAR domain-containing protein [Treponema sp.]
MESSVAGSESVLIVTNSEKSGSNSNVSLFTEALAIASIKRIKITGSAGEARRMLLEKNFNIVVVDAPLTDESGEDLARHIAVKGFSQVILAVNSEHFNTVSAVCQQDGILTISKPIDKQFFWSVLTLARSVSGRFKRIQDENARLKQKIEDIRIIDRAKCMLISYLSLSEQEAHRFIEKQAMDLRSTKKAIAEGILKTYAN